MGAIRKGAAKYKNGQLSVNGISIGLWELYGLSKYELPAGSFNEDSRGRWYVNIAVKVQVEEKRVPDGATPIGIDPGLKTMATYSDGTAFDMPRCYRQSARGGYPQANIRAGEQTCSNLRRQRERESAGKNEHG